MNIGNVISVEQKQTLSLFIKQSLAILAMNNIELGDFLQKEQLDNPVLEFSPAFDTQSFQNIAGWLKNDRPLPAVLSAAEDDFATRCDIPAREAPSIKDYLKSQLDLKGFCAREIRAVDMIIDLLDDDGLLTSPLEEICFLTRLSPAAAQKCVTALQALEPCGIAHASLSDCLKAQLRASGRTDPLLFSLVDCLPEIAGGKYARIALRLGLPVKQVKCCADIIRSLNPRPARGFCADQTLYIVPDMIVTENGDGYEIALNNDRLGSLAISSYYRDLLYKTDDPEIVDYLKIRLARAVQLLKSVEHRRETVIRIGEAILERQTDFFKGTAPLRPMVMREVAATLGVHESTVSRAVKNKYLQCRRGAFSLKSFFISGGYLNENACRNDGDVPDLVSRDHIKSTLLSLIKAEDARKPLSDSALCTRLEGMGFSISRRTVAKYRDELGVKNAFDRKAAEKPLFPS